MAASKALSRSSVRCMAALLVGLLCLGVYVGTVAPGLTWAHDSSDGGELAACAYVLGIAHPPGYPTYTLLAHLPSRLTIGEVARGTNLFSALCAALAVALTVWAAMGVGCGWVAAVSASTLLAFSPLLWGQATVTEVHALNALFMALLLSLAVAAGRDRSRAVIPLAAGVTLGLGLGNSPTLACGAPLFALAVWRQRRWWGLGLLGLALGLSVYAYLPLRAAAGPPINWGDPRTLERLWWLVSGRIYHGGVFSVPWRHLGSRLLAWGGLLTRQFLGVGLLWAGLGAAAMRSRNRALLVASGATSVLCSLFAVGYDTTDSYLYLIPALVCIALWAGVGLQWSFSALAAHGPRTLWAGQILALAIPLVALVARFPAMDLSSDHSAEEFLAGILEQAPSRSLLLSREDAHTFALWYARVTGRRPDVAVVDVDLLGFEWYGAQLAEYLDPDEVRMLQERQEDAGLARLLRRPVCQGMPSGEWVCWAETGE